MGHETKLKVIKETTKKVGLIGMVGYKRGCQGQRNQNTLIEMHEIVK